MALAGAGTACIDDPDLELDDLESEVGTENKLSANKLSANKLSANKLSANKLSANSLASRDMLSTADGREVMSYVVGCALPSGQSITLQDNGGASHTFTGRHNLAPQWATRAPTVAERRWVSACLLARTNVFGVPVSISMRHDSYLPLASTTTERTQYSNVEGAFWGDLFGTTPVLYACGSRNWAQYAQQSFRACALSQSGSYTDCNFQYMGRCDTGPACTDTVAPYNGCRVGATTYSEVITIYLTPTQQQGGSQ
jgi:hypothetical protein